ncbi:MAG: SCO6745 family protein [Acidimicrobiia bacterium]
MAFSGTLSDARVSEVSRRLRSRCDAILGAVWFMPEAARGFPSLAGRVACLGRVRGEVAAALLAPLHPSSTIRAIDEAWRVHDPEALLAERLGAATRYLAAVIGEHPDGIERAVSVLKPAVEAGPVEGHPLFAGLRTLAWPCTPLGDLWRAADMVRERRGDSHRNAWVAAGLSALEIQVLTERWRTRTNPGSTTAERMGWTGDDIASALDDLRGQGWIDAAGALTAAGRAFRDEIELATDRQERPLVEALGDDVDELFDLLAPWARAVVSGAQLPAPDGRGA